LVDPQRQNGKAYERPTFKAGDRRSVIDRWLTNDPAIINCRVRTEQGARFPATAKAAGHAVVSLNIRRLPDPCKGFPKYDAIPFRVVNEKKNNIDLAKRLRELPVASCPVAEIETITAAAWTWFRALPPQSRYKKNSFTEIFKAAARSCAHATISIAAIHDAAARVKLPFDAQALTKLSGGRVILPTAMARDVAALLDLYRVQVQTINHLNDVHAAVAGKKKTPVLWQRIRALSPKFDNSLFALNDANGVPTANPEDIGKIVLEPRQFWTVRPDNVSPEVDSLLRWYSGTCSKFQNFRPPTIEHLKHAVLI
jgi:hypothetical protein